MRPLAVAETSVVAVQVLPAAPGRGAWGDRYFEKVTWPPRTGTSSIQVWPAGTSSL